jgi:hypothetical protein
MLRNAVLGFALLVLTAGLVLLAVQPAQAFGALVFGTLLTIGTLFERWRYKPLKTAQAAHGVATGERFVDPVSGVLMEVYYDAASGERSYVKVNGGKTG